MSGVSGNRPRHDFDSSGAKVACAQDRDVVALAFSPLCSFLDTLELGAIDGEAGHIILVRSESIGKEMRFRVRIVQV